MKKILTLFLVTCCLLTCIIPVYAEEVEAKPAEYKTMYTIATVNVRAGASTKAKVVTVFKKGRVVRVIHVGKKWNLIKYGNRKCYIYNKYLSTKKPKTETKKTETLNDAKYSANYFKQMGVINWNGWRWTWYSQRVLPGGGLKIPGRHVGPGGYVMDENGYICLAATSLSKGTVVSTPFGAKGKVYDSGCARGTLDVYVDW